MKQSMKSKRKPIRQSSDGANNRKRILQLQSTLGQLIQELQGKFNETQQMFQLAEQWLLLLSRAALGENMSSEEWQRLRDFLPREADKDSAQLELPFSESGPHPAVEE